MTKVVTRRGDTGERIESLETAVLVTLPPDEREEALATDSIFKPSRDMKKLKASFYTRAKLDKNFKLENTTAELLVALTGIPEAAAWFTNPAFKAWLFNVSETEEKLNYLLNRSLDNLGEVIDGDPVLFTTKEKLAAQAQLLSMRHMLIEEQKAAIEIERHEATSPIRVEAAKKQAFELFQKMKAEEEKLKLEAKAREVKLDKIR